MKPLYIFDLDGTLADPAHRLKFILDTAKKNWKAFYAACQNDRPIEPVIKTFQMLQKHADVWIWTGRSDEVLTQTRAWLEKHEVVPTSWPHGEPHRLKMRKEGDYRPDTEIKRQWLASLDPVDRTRLVATFEDRASVVEMWRDNGVMCFQMATGDF